MQVITRLQHALSHAGAPRLRKSQRTRFATVNGQWFKRLILHDAFLAAEMERNLTHFGPSELIPPFLIRYEHEVWVEYVPGKPVRHGDARTARDLAAFYAAVNTRRSREVALAQTGFDTRLERDLRFLGMVGVLDRSTSEALWTVREAVRPERVRVGFDYTDPILKNFIRHRDTGALAAVDVESLRDGQLIGTGPAKALMRWMEPHRAAFFDAYRAAAGIDLEPGFAYVKLCFLAGYTRLKVMERKWRYVQPQRFQRLLAFADLPATSTRAPVETETSVQIRPGAAAS